MDTWYYHRKELAAKYLSVLDLGISSNIGIFAPRRKGKTLFLLHDIAEASRQSGYLPIYISLWQNINRPQDGIILALMDALAAIDAKQTLGRIFKNKIKKVSLGNELIGKVDIELAQNPEQTSDQELMQIDQLLTQLIKKAKKKKVLLMIDEIQHLATAPSFDSLSYALRTMLDKRMGELKTIMTGSSRHYMHCLFNQSKSPFYHFIEIMPFPELGKDYLAFLSQTILSISDKTIAASDLKKVFDEVDQSPYWMMKVISYMLSHDASLKHSLAYILDVIEEAEDYHGLCQQLKPIDKIIYCVLAEGGNPFGEQTLQLIDRQTEVKGVLSNVQRAIKRLMDKHIITQLEKRHYVVEKPGLKKYMDHLALNIKN